MKPTTLSHKGIALLMENSGTPIVLQVMNIQAGLKQCKTGKAYVSQLSDGYTKLKCYWPQSLFDKINNAKNRFNGAIVKLTDYFASTKKVLISQFDIIFLYDQIIGDPVSYQQYLTDKVSTKADNRIQTQKAILFQPIQKSQSINEIKQTISKNQNMKSNINSPCAKMERIKAKHASNYQTIDQLYTGMDGWTLFCRVNKVNYRQFTNKKGAKTKLLEFQIKDKNDWLIKCTIFGNHAQKMSKNICQGEVYTFSRGSIKIDTYKTVAHDKDSPLTINFNQHSKILLSTNDNSIKQKQSVFKSILDIKSCVTNGQIDVVCIIKEIMSQSIYINKNTNQTHPKRTMIVCDPINRIQSEVTFWRNNVNIIDESLLHKVVVLQSFKVSQFNQKLSLTATIRSRIYQLKGHKLNGYQNCINSGDFEFISFKKGENFDQKKNMSNMKNLLKQCENLVDKQVIWSTFRVYLNRNRDQGKKWYCGCPLNKCKKTVQEDEIKCFHCGTSFEKPMYRYILGIQLSDSLGQGSLWTTAYDQFCQKILSFQQNLPAEKARLLSEQDFSQIMKKCHFQQFKVTICSKVQQSTDFNRRIKHQITNYSAVDPIKQSKINLQRIRTYI